MAMQKDGRYTTADYYAYSLQTGLAMREILSVECSR